MSNHRTREKAKEPPVFICLALEIFSYFSCDILTPESPS